jgi:hypothetical protein
MPAVMTVRVAPAPARPAITVDGNSSRSTTTASAATSAYAAIADPAPESSPSALIEAVNAPKSARPRTLLASASTKTPASSTWQVVSR